MGDGKSVALGLRILFSDDFMIEACVLVQVAFAKCVYIYNNINMQIALGWLSNLLCSRLHSAHLCVAALSVVK